MLAAKSTRQELLARIARLEDALAAVARWSMETATDPTATGYGQWIQLVPRKPGAPPETPPPLRYRTDRDELDEDVNALLRTAIDGNAAAIQALATSFHLRRGEAGLRRDLERARQSVKTVYDDIERAQAMLDRQSDRMTH